VNKLNFTTHGLFVLIHIEEVICEDAAVSVQYGVVSHCPLKLAFQLSAFPVKSWNNTANVVLYSCTYNITLSWHDRPVQSASQPVLVFRIVTRLLCVHDQLIISNVYSLLYYCRR